uniref:alanine--tRNA ligase n=1 Tax=Sphaeramia orbicularis TaxID=375764 RepID=A0A673A096_9TELE
MIRLLTVLHRPPWFRSGLVRSCSGLPPDRTAARIRNTFLNFFRDRGHLLVPSAPVRPRGDPSLLFVNAGMNQFKPILLGTVDPRSPMASYRRVANSQKCVRAGGKHNDLDDVGRDVYHHTFFEMMGSWSFGDYFKEEACQMAWSLLTEHYGLPVDRLYVSYFGGDAAFGLPPDDETRQIWLEIGVQANRILPFGLKENFWEMGDSGPCGPCTEIHYDHVGGRDGAALVNNDTPDLVEIWNLVFMQYNRELDGSLRPLPQCSVDTGMGLERLVRILQNKTSNYDTDLFTPLLDHIHQVSCVDIYGGRKGSSDQEKVDMAYRVVADHIRTLSVCIADGIHPGMSGAELVLRRILRRALRFCVEVLQAPQGSLAGLVPTVTHILPAFFQIMDVINENEAQFLSSLQQGSRLIHRTLNRMENKHGLFPASVAWSLHRDLGFPLDLVDLVLEERGVRVDREELDRLISENHKSQSGPQSQLSLDILSLSELQRLGVPHTNDSLKYQYSLDRDRYVFPACCAVILALYDGHSLRSEVSEGQRCAVILDRTCFYAEQGGQSHDQGYFTRNGSKDVVYPVDAVEQVGGYVVHHVTTSECLKTGDQVELHLDQVSLSVSQLQQVESCVMDVISANQRVYSEELPLLSAKTISGLRTVDEVYPDPVRVVSVGIPVSELLNDQTDKQTSYSMFSLCGISRIVAVTGRDARELGQAVAQDVDSLSARLAGSTPSSLVSAHCLAKEVGILSDAVDNTPIPQWQRRDLQNQLKVLQRTTNTTVRKLEVREVRLTEALLQKHGKKDILVDSVDTDSLSVVMKTVNQLSTAAPNAVVMLLAHQVHSGKVLCACQVPKGSASSSLLASDWAVAVCQHLGGGAGGNAVVAQGTGSSDNIIEVLRWAEQFAVQKIQR